MNIKPAFYLHDLKTAPLGAFSRISQLGWPVVVDAQELQVHPRATEIMTAFSENQLRFLSTEVEHFMSPLGMTCAQAIDNEWTHLIVVGHYDESVLEQLSVLSQRLVSSPFEVLFFNNKVENEREASGFLRRLLDLGDLDYRRLKTKTVVYPVFFLQNIDLKKIDSLEFDKVLVKLLLKRVPFSEVTVNKSVIEKPKSLWLKARSEFYDWWLLALSSLHANQSPVHSALSFGTGAFLACTPFYGLQTGLIVLFCFLFRLNFPIAFLGSQISLPPIYSLIVPLQLYVGFYLTGTESSFDGPLLEVARNHFESWLIGAFLVGGVISLFMGTVWYYVQKKSQKQEATWTGKMRGGRFGNQLMVGLLKILGLRFGYFLLFFIVPYFYIFSPKARRGLNQYYHLVQRKSGFFHRQWLVLKHFYKFAQILVDQAFQAFHKELCFDIEYVKGDALKTHSESGAQLMLFSHFGGWAISTQGFSRRGAQKPIHLIRYQTQDLSSDKVFQESNRQNLELINIKPGEPLFMIIHQVLGEGGNLAIMGDRPFDNSFELKKFMGRLAPIPTTPFRLAKTYKAKINFVFGFRRGFCSYGLATESIERASVDEMMEAYLNCFSTYITQYPDQWFNLYPYWSSLPTLPNGKVCVPTKNCILK